MFILFGFEQEILLFHLFTYKSLYPGDLRDLESPHRGRLTTIFIFS